MAGYQFIHVEAYARQSSKANRKERKRSAAEIVGEAERAPGHYERHVREPKPPTILHGVAPSAALAEAEEVAETVKDAQGRKLRKDAPILLAGVVSVDASNAERWPAIRDDSIRFLKGKYGDRLRSVVEHTDEAHPHLHFYVVPKAGERALDLHPGHAAKKAAGSRKDTPAGELNAAYCEAMTAFQVEYEAAVGVWHGLTRIGPQRRRLTRKGWQAEKKAADDRVAGFDAAAEVAKEVQARKLAEVAKLPTPTLDSIAGGAQEAQNRPASASRAARLAQTMEKAEIAPQQPKI